MIKTVKDTSIEVVWQGFLSVIRDHNEDEVEAGDVFKAALEDVGSDMSLFALSRATPIPEHDLGRRTERHRQDFLRILGSVGLSHHIFRLIARQLYMEMSEQLHLIHGERRQYNLQPQMAV